jgi:hypothetical protein
MIAVYYTVSFPSPHTDIRSQTHRYRHFVEMKLIVTCTVVPVHCIVHCTAVQVVID